MRALLVDVSKRMLGLFLIVPHQVCISGEFPCDRITSFLNSIDVADIMFP